MKLTNKMLIDSTKSLSEISQKQLPIRISYKIAKNISLINDELKIYDEQKNKIMNEYSKKDKDGKPVIDKNGHVELQKERIKDWTKDFMELLSIEIEININKFSIDSMGNCDISPSQIMSLGFMIED